MAHRLGGGLVVPMLCVARDKPVGVRMFDILYGLGNVVYQLNRFRNTHQMMIVMKIVIMIAGR